MKDPVEGTRKQTIVSRKMSLDAPSVTSFPSLLRSNSRPLPYRFLPAFVSLQVSWLKGGGGGVST